MGVKVMPVFSEEYAQVVEMDIRVARHSFGYEVWVVVVKDCDLDKPLFCVVALDHRAFDNHGTLAAAGDAVTREVARIMSGHNVNLRRSSAAQQFYLAVSRCVNSRRASAVTTILPRHEKKVRGYTRWL